jgi:hypothetical protein
MKAVFIIGVLLFLLFTVSSASAAQTFYLTKTSENVSGISIKVTLDGNKIFVEDVSSVVNANKADIKGIRLYLGNEYISSVTDPGASSNNWGHSSDYKQNFAGFGDFNSYLAKATGNVKSRGPIEITLTQPFTQLPTNAVGNSIVVHLGFGTELIDVSGNKQDSSWVAGGTQIPEFPTMALPVAAVLGLLFITQRRKEN